MPYCGSCGQSVNEGAKFCSACGARSQDPHVRTIQTVGPVTGVVKVEPKLGERSGLKGNPKRNILLLALVGTLAVITAVRMYLNYDPNYHYSEPKKEQPRKMSEEESLRWKLAGEGISVRKLPSGYTKFYKHHWFSPDEVLLLLPPDSDGGDSGGFESEKQAVKKMGVQTLLKPVTVVERPEAKCEGTKCFTTEVGERVVMLDSLGYWKRVKVVSGVHKGQEGWAFLHDDDLQSLAQ